MSAPDFISEKEMKEHYGSRYDAKLAIVVHNDHVYQRATDLAGRKGWQRLSSKPDLVEPASPAKAVQAIRDVIQENARLETLLGQARSRLHELLEATEDQLEGVRDYARLWLKDN